MNSDFSPFAFWKKKKNKKKKQKSEKKSQERRTRIGRENRLASAIYFYQQNQSSGYI